MSIRRLHLSPCLRVLAMLLLGLSLASSAQAATVTIPGSPMTVYVGDSGGVTGRLAGDDSNVFFPPFDNETPSAGFNLGFPAAVGTIPGDSNFGPTGEPFTPISQGSVTGAGTPTNPFRIATVYKASDGSTDAAEVTQVVSYVNGTGRFAISYSVRNVSDAPLRFRAGEYADLYLAGSDTGTGFFDPGPPRLVGGSGASGRTGGIEEVANSPWDAYQEDHFGTVSSALADLTGPGLANTVNPAEVDNGAAVQWDDFFEGGLASNATTTFATVWTFGGLLLSPAAAERAAGAVHTVAVTLRDPNGTVGAGQTVRYTVGGANPTGGALATGGAGEGAISWRGSAPGLDTLRAYADLDGDGAQDGGEPTATATVHWIGAGATTTTTAVDNSIDAQLARLPAPRLGRAVNVALVEGEVFVKLPAGGARAAQAKGRGFVPLRQARQIPVGSLLDTSGGTVRLVSAATGGKRQQGDFNGGFFTAIQSRRARGLTELRMTRGRFSGCASKRGRGGKAEAAARSRRVVRRLRGNARGRFRTRGRYSAATVRGTDWTVSDRCDGTLTRVKRGSVVVRDLRRRKDVIVKAGRSRLVRAPG